MKENNNFKKPMSTKTKAYIAGISLIIASIAGCTYNITTATKAPSDAIAEGVAGIQDGVKIIKVEDSSTTQQKQ